ncbi:tyrosinase cofactor [Actinacidiphila acidipaludis]|uniref:Tyrosinase cofactor n=1 Tax=Actinacidiphila acidipaludis TaxID=2873382 RepID=A0ABS7Q3P8_9ACTN|nr:tyrosinase cofactor [Streptomyces acidipaludis]MBY8877578.1 tyrosinase cofactor [Streptomyces acidipaludis]
MVTRRRVLTTGLTTVAAVSGTAAALHPMLAADEPSAHGGSAASADAALGNAAGGTPLFDEVYRGRRIQGYSTADDDRIALLVDGRPLHVMRRVDGSWISMANHYQPYTTPLDTARGAVDVMRHADLSAAPVQLSFLHH